MPYKIEIRPLAKVEILEAYDWYDAQREGLGLEFLEELDAFYASLNRNPYIYSFYEEPVRQGRLKRFPYTVVYEVIDLKIIVYSVFMIRQDPSKKRSI
jgi:plasmid stabilization system protein ParE